MSIHNQEHPDLLAYAEGRMNGLEREAAASHIDACRACRQELSQLSLVLDQLHGVISRVKAAYGSAEELTALVDAAFDPDKTQPEFIVQRSDMIHTLTPALKAKLSSKTTLAERLGKAVQNLTGMGKDAADQLSRRILGGGQAPLGAPAVRKDATKVEDAPQASSGDQPPGSEPK
jgi:anti-sigma factor ChrR (cupin superfamily)